MKIGYTHIAVLVDSSGSMASIKKDMIGGFNTFLKEQQDADGEATLTLAQFDTYYKPIIPVTNIKEVPQLTDGNYIIGGMTALNDSLAKTINETGTYLASLAEDQRPERVLLIVITDGGENASKEYELSDVKAMIQHQEQVYNWKVVYIGANVDVQAETKSRGINTMSAFMANSQGVGVMYKKMSASTALYRSAGAYDDKSVQDAEIHLAGLATKQAS